MHAVTSGGRRWAGVLDRLAGRRPGRDDRGAVAVTVAILLAGGVLLGMLALVIDVGRLYVERTVLQTSADSAALAVAKACSQYDSPHCDDQAAVESLAEIMADANAGGDGRADVVDVCGFGGPDVTLVPCPETQPTNLTACLDTVPDGVPYVEVNVRTETSDGDFVLPPVFAQTMTGNEAYTGASVMACARATWGVDELTIMAMTISECEFADATDNGTAWNDEVVIEFWRGGHSQCDEPAPGGWNTPGPAGFLLTSNPNCRIEIDPDGVVDGDYFDFDDFVLAPGSCEALVRDSRQADRTIYLPIHDGHRGTETDRQYHHISVAPFVVTGFQFGAPVNSTNPPYLADDHRERSDFSLPAEHPCDVLRHRCVSGYFTGPPVSIANLTPDTFVRLIG